MLWFTHVRRDGMRSFANASLIKADAAKSVSKAAVWKAAVVSGFCLGLLWLGGAAPASAGTITLADGNSMVTLDPSSWPA